MAVPYTFGTATAAIPLSQLDTNFATAITLGNTAVYLGNTTTSIGNLTLTNVTISSGSVTITDTTVSGNVTLSGGTANGVAYLNGSKVLATGSALTFDGTNLGINTGSPGAPLDVNGTVGIIRNTATTGTNQVYTRQGNTGGYFYTGLDTSAGGFLTGSAYAGFLWMTGAYPMVFGTSNAEQMRLTSTGLGIGTSSPAARLSVITASANSTAATIGGIEYGGNKRGLTIKTYQSNGGDDCGVEFNAANGLATYGSFKFSANTTTFATIDYSGNLGLGVTPSAGFTSSRLIQVASSVWQARTGTPDTFQLFANGYLNSGASAYNYIGTGYATRYDQTGGQHQWYNAASGTAGNAITFTQAMTLDASGNLLVGTTSATLGSLGNFVKSNSTNYMMYVENSANTSGDKTFRSVLGSNCNNTSSFHFVANTGGNDKLYIYGNGNVVNANNSYGSLSDVKLKENIVDASPKLADLMQVQVRNYNLIGDTTKQLGVVAQELETVFPALVDETNDTDAEGNDLGTTTKSVKYSVFVPMLIKAIQEQQALIESLTTRLTALEGKA